MGLVLLAWLIFFVIPGSEIDHTALFVDAYDWLRRNAANG
jgi:hypothetical protein